MDFHKVEFDDIDDMERDRLAELVQEFAKAQEQNLSELEEVESEIKEFSEFESEITDEIIEYSSLSEEAASALPFSEKRALLDDLNATEESAEDGGEDGDGSKFEDRGTRGETQTEGDEGGVPEHVEQAFSGISGVQL
jgi:hypothetical protein